MKNVILILFILISFNSISQTVYNKSFFENQYYKKINFWWGEYDQDSNKYTDVGIVQSVYINKYYKNDYDMSSIAPAFVKILCTTGLNKGKILTITINPNNNSNCEACVKFNNSLSINSKIKFQIERHNNEIFFFSKVEFLL